ncbi:sterol 24-C-methyltransferase [Cladophialophora carrionii]|uniref:Sterol 24-C-methyltransferase n=1 Tax=Cladophialophora carrionii TaxID=86049 RepID=A0A1C1CY99_9EURO|nr:sterol 24-C-methyltransferase [Cladophialophora carrionii]
MGDHHGHAKKIKDFSKVISTFSSHYNGSRDDDDDRNPVSEEDRKTRQEKAAQVSDSYYAFATAAYEANWSTHFHYAPFPPTYPPHDATLATAMQFCEHRLAHLANLRADMLVLDVGCGIGAPARAIARLTGCTVVGLTINQGQVDRAIYLTAVEALSHRCTFLQGDFVAMPFADRSFDAAFAIEATCHAASLAAVYAEIHRVLKPGAAFASSEWVLTPRYDGSDVAHVRMRNRIERGNAIVDLQTSEQAKRQFLAAGFDIEHEEDFAVYFDRPHHGSGPSSSSSSVLIPFASGMACAPPPSVPLPLPDALLAPPTMYRPWTFPLRGRHDLATTWTDWWTCFKMSRLTRRLCYWYVYFGEKVGLVDEGVMQAMQTMAVCVDSVADAGEAGIFSPCWWFVGRKRVEDGGVKERGATGSEGP